jgi:methylglutaconyl-CoA hydratase
MTDNPEEMVLLDADSRGVATVTLNRPELHNALNGEVIDRLADIWDDLDKQDGVRAVVLRANGRSFCAGADLNWMKAAQLYTYDQNLEDATALAEMLNALHCLSKPTIALVHGHCFAGGLGLVSACDIVVAQRGVQFALTETKLGLLPATISPYVLAAIGPRQAKRYFLTAERFDADQAQRIGLVHELAADAAGLQEALDRLLGHLLAAAPGAIAETKSLIDDVAFEPIDEVVIEDTARRIAERRVSEEGREGLASFLEKRQPAWVRSDV